MKIGQTKPFSLLLWLFLIFWLCPVSAQQNRNIDSLNNALKFSKVDTVNVLCEVLHKSQLNMQTKNNLQIKIDISHYHFICTLHLVYL
jgi:hypothetical protein